MANEQPKIEQPKTAPKEDKIRADMAKNGRITTHDIMALREARGQTLTANK
jgi:hypothetical protein